MSENDRNVVHVLTAGGAASPARKRREDPRSVSFTSPPPAASNNNRAAPSSSGTPQSSTTQTSATDHALHLELEGSAGHLDHSNDDDHDDDGYNDDGRRNSETKGLVFEDVNLNDPLDHHHQQHRHRTASGGMEEDDNEASSAKSELLWLLICFFGIMGSFVIYGLLMEYTTSGGRKLHELSFLFVTSGLYTLTAAAGRYVRDETPTTIPPARFAVLGLTSMGSTWCSVRSLRYVIYPIQVLAKSCKPVPVMLAGTILGKRYPLRKYFNVALIVGGVAMFMGGGDGDGAAKKEGVAAAGHGDDPASEGSPSQMIGILLLFISLSFDGFTGTCACAVVVCGVLVGGDDGFDVMCFAFRAGQCRPDSDVSVPSLTSSSAGSYEDKLMAVHSVQPFDLMYNIQLGKTILAGIGLVVFNQLHIFIQMVQDMGLMLVALGLSGAIGQVFIFVTIAKFGALTCSIIGLARKITTLVASIYFYGHTLNSVQFAGLAISVGSMVMNFMGKSKAKGGGHGPGDGHGGPSPPPASEEMEKMLDGVDGSYNDGGGAVELAPRKY
jgi:solute carrier family 35 (UDP-galactose transporter), member B1